MTGLYALKAICKKFEFELEGDRDPLVNIVNDCFGVLGQLVNTLINSEQHLAYVILLQICKVFFISNQLRMCPSLMNELALDPWVEFFI